MEQSTVEKKQKSKEKILEVLRLGNKSQKEVTIASNVNGSLVNVLLRKLVEEGIVKREKEELGKKKLFIYSVI